MGSVKPVTLWKRSGSHLGAKLAAFSLQGEQPDPSGGAGGGGSPP